MLWLASRGRSAGKPVICGLVRGGHAALIPTLAPLLAPMLTFLPTDDNTRCMLLEEAARSCPLARLKQVFAWFGPNQAAAAAAAGGGTDAQGQSGGGAALFPGQTWIDWPGYRDRVLAAAAGSVTTDWFEKLVWLEGQGCRRTARACELAAAMPDATQRLQWLFDRGYPLSEAAAVAAARAGNRDDVLSFMLKLRPGNAELVKRTIVVAAEAGNFKLVQALVRLGARLDSTVFDAAASSGNAELLASLHGWGCLWSGPRAFANAAASGNSEALRLLQRLDCPPGDDGQPYIEACRHGDVATVTFLALQGCPWGASGVVFWAAVRSVRSGDVHWSLLPRLLQAGCPSGLSVPTAAAVLKLEARPAPGHPVWAKLAADGISGLR